MFRETFRVDREIVVQIEQSIARFLQYSRRNNSLSPRQQILSTLTFIGNGAQYHANGYIHGISKATVCRCIHRVCKMIVIHLMPYYIRWPTSTIRDEALFARKAGFPNVKGIVDGTLIHILAPFVDEPIYVGRDNKHSINLMVVSGPKNQFYYASAAFPGSFHDARCIKKSSLWTMWDDRGWRPDDDENSIILGDSAYPLRRWLIPPTIRNVNANIRYLANAVPVFERAHRKTRFIVECSIGILKQEFLCLRFLRVKEPRNISTIIYTCVTLHNMQNAFHRGSYSYDDVLNRIANQEIPNDPEEPQFQEVQENDLAGVNRQRQILEYFARR